MRYYNINITIMRLIFICMGRKFMHRMIKKSFFSTDFEEEQENPIRIAFEHATTVCVFPLWTGFCGIPFYQTQARYMIDAQAFVSFESIASYPSTYVFRWHSFAIFMFSIFMSYVGALSYYTNITLF